MIRVKKLQSRNQNRPGIPCVYALVALTKSPGAQSQVTPTLSPPASRPICLLPTKKVFVSLLKLEYL